ncbi:MAG: type III-A CRISPR-associated RAMP protein Csm3 [Nitrospirae bacterium CG08_land_8_20_14_0_20_52_24]|nr:MAG: type III-A CRISPR-associated RAMP protein Csm3 [Nitrospirae bacterium CG08_land_8_20_14_0_20_52_24]
MTDTQRPDFAFIGKYIISADIELKTGLHIGGTEEGFDIGGVDNPVIKDKATGVPYIPGSSLKGKMRSLLEWAYNQVKIEFNDKTHEWEGKLCNDSKQPIGIVFGVAAEYHEKDSPGPTRLTVRDASPDKVQVDKWDAAMGEKIYTEAKAENAIDRLTSAANPRTMERVPAGSVFKVEFVYDVYHKDDRNHLKLLFEGMRLLEDAYLGGGGTRGSGQVEFKNIKIMAKDKSAYIGEGSTVLVAKQNGQTTLDAVLDSFDNIFPEF